MGPAGLLQPRGWLRSRLDGAGARMELRARGGWNRVAGPDGAAGPPDGTARRVRMDGCQRPGGMQPPPTATVDTLIDDTLISSAACSILGPCWPCTRSRLPDERHIGDKRCRPVSMGPQPHGRVACFATFPSWQTSNRTPLAPSQSRSLSAPSVVVSHRRLLSPAADWHHETLGCLVGLSMPRLPATHTYLYTLGSNRTEQGCMHVVIACFTNFMSNCNTTALTLALSLIRSHTRPVTKPIIARVLVLTVLTRRPHLSRTDPGRCGSSARRLRSLCSLSATRLDTLQCSHITASLMHRLDAGLRCPYYYSPS